MRKVNIEGKSLNVLAHELAANYLLYLPPEQCRKLAKDVIDLVQSIRLSDTVDMLSKVQTRIQAANQELAKIAKNQ